MRDIDQEQQLSIAIRERLGLKPDEDVFVENEVLGLHRRFPQIPAAEIKRALLRHCRTLGRKTRTNRHG